MKRLIALLCALITVFTLCACVEPQKKSSESLPETAQKTTKRRENVLDQPNELIAEGRKFEAALLLWANKDSEEALDLFKTFAERICMKKVCTNSNGDRTVYEYAIDPDGLVISEKATYQDGTVLTYDYEYSGSHPVKITLKSDGEVSNVTEITYDEAGNRLKMTNRYSDDSVDLNEYSYDSAGRLLSQKTTMRDGYVILCTNEYDSLGRIVKDSTSYSDGGTIVWEYFYNGEDKKPCRNTYTDSDGSVTVTETAYDGNWNTLTETVTYPDGETERTENSYNSSGKLKTSVRKTRDGDELTSTYEYDGSGNVVHALIAEDFGTTEFDYVYGSEGDLIKETVKSPDGDTEVYEYSDYTVVLKREYY